MPRPPARVVSASVGQASTQGTGSAQAVQMSATMRPITPPRLRIWIALFWGEKL